MYNCQICTLENDINAAFCAVCGSPRGPLEPLQEAWRKQHEPAEEVNKPAKPTGEPHLKALVHTLKRLISREQEKNLSSMPVEETKEEVPEQDKEEIEEKDSDIDLENLP